MGNYTFNIKEVGKQAIGDNASINHELHTNNIMGDKVQQTFSGGTFNAQVVGIMNECTNIVHDQPEGDRKKLMTTLQTQADELFHALPDDQRENAAKSLKSLFDEVESRVPRRAWYNLSTKGLVDAAAAVGKAAPAIGGTLLTLGKLIWPDFELPV